MVCVGGFGLKGIFVMMSSLYDIHGPIFIPETFQGFGVWLCMFDLFCCGQRSASLATTCVEVPHHQLAAIAPGPLH